MLCAVCYRFALLCVVLFVSPFYEKFSAKIKGKESLYTGDIMMLKWLISTFNVFEVCCAVMYPTSKLFQS